jgi:ATP-dependent Zn protease
MNEAATDELENKGHSYHEAGHAVFQSFFGMKLVGVSILPKGLSAGRSEAQGEHQIILGQRGVFFEGTPERARYLCHRIMIVQAGEVAQKELCPESFHDSQCGFDHLKAQTLIEEWDHYAYLHEREEKLAELYESTRQLVSTPWCTAAIEALAQALLEHKQLTGGQARQLIIEAILKTAKERKSLGEPPLNYECPHCARDHAWNNNVR